MNKINKHVVKSLFNFVQFLVFPLVNFTIFGVHNTDETFGLHTKTYLGETPRNRLPNNSETTIVKHSTVHNNFDFSSNVTQATIKDCNQILLIILGEYKQIKFNFYSS